MVYFLRTLYLPSGFRSLGRLLRNSMRVDLTFWLFIGKELRIYDAWQSVLKSDKRRCSRLMYSSPRFLASVRLCLTTLWASALSFRGVSWSTLSTLDILDRAVSSFWLSSPTLTSRPLRIWTTNP